MTEDNAYEDTTRVDGANEKNGGDQKDAENVQGLPAKFKSVSALARAYEALQAEFTRRSQRLKELERKTENLEETEQKEARKAEKPSQSASKQSFDEISETEKIEADGLGDLKPVTNEKLPTDERSERGISENGATMYEMKPDSTEAQTNREEEERFRERELSQTENAAFEKGESAVLDEARKGETTSPSAAKGGESAEAAQSLYERARNDEGVRLKIIGEYLSSIGKTDAPLMAGGTGILATPPKKAKSITQAGDMALLYFKGSVASLG